MSNLEKYPSQLLVPGRGIEPAWAWHAGEVIFNSPHSGDSYDRALAAAIYAEEYDVDHIEFSGRYSLAMLPSERTILTEAHGMLAVGLQHGIGLNVDRIGLDFRAQSSFGNITHTIKRFNPLEPIGLVAHDNHMDRLLRTAKFVAPEVKWVPVLADNPDREPLPINENDSAADKIYKLAMKGVKAGEIDKIRRRDAMVIRYVGGVIIGAKTAVGLVRRNQHADYDLAS